jgi:uncharacterized membrane protein YbhN (UPF0104 family)
VTGGAPRWRRVVPVLVSIALVAVVLSLVDADAVAQRLRGMGWGWLLAAAALGPLQVALGGWRWARVSRGLGVPLATGPAIAEYGLSTGLNQVLPTGIAGDAVRVWRQRHEGLAAAAHAAVVDRALGLASLVLLTAVSLSLWPPGPGGWTRGIGVSVVLVTGIGVLASPMGAPTRRLLRADGLFQVGLSVLLTLTFVLGFGLAG